MTETLLSLPHATYFPNLASQLRSIWMNIDLNLIKDFNFDDLRDEVEDINDLLMYFQEIFHAKIPRITRALSNSLLFYAYFPSALGSLSCTTRNPDINSYSATIFFLSQTYNYIKEPCFINSLSLALFLSHIPVQYDKIIQGDTKVPRSFRRHYKRKSKISILHRYTEEYLSLTNFESFINNNYSFLNELQDEYQELKSAYMESDNITTEELSRKGMELVANKLASETLDKLSKYHKQLSIAIGKPVGLIERNKKYEIMSPTDFCEFVIDCIYDGSF